MISSTTCTRLALSPATLHWFNSVALCYRVAWHYSGAKWSIMLVLYCSRIVAACLHVLQALTALPARTPCMQCQAP
jgi:hypothetical protein